MGHLFESERKRIDEQNWREALGVEPYVRVGREWVLNKRPDGACVFLDESNRCRIHSRFGESAKPIACRVFPFSLRAVPRGWQASFRFDCPSAASSSGRPIQEYEFWLRDLASQIPRPRRNREHAVELQRGLRAAPEEIDFLARKFGNWWERNDLSARDLAIGAARITITLAEANLAKVRGRRLGNLLDLLFGAMPSERANRPAAPTAKMRGLLRQVCFAHAEHASIDEMRAGIVGRLRLRWRQLKTSRRFLRGRGEAPDLPGVAGRTGFEQVEAVRAAGSDQGGGAIENLLSRYVLARLSGRAFCGGGYYGWPVVAGLGALWLSLAATGWLARYTAACGGRTAVSFDDAAAALGIVDRAATRLPVLGTVSERIRLRFLFADDGLPRLVRAYWPVRTDEAQGG